MNLGILTNESWGVEEEEDYNDETMTERVEGGDELEWVFGEDDPPDDFRYNGEGKKIRCNSQEYEEDIV